MNFDVGYLLTILPEIIRYLPVTLYISLLSILLATLLGAVITLLLYGSRPLSAIAHLYISFFRGTPVLVQLLIIYFGLPQLFPWLNALSATHAVILGLSLNSAAYLAEVFRSAVDAVERGQWEAALASGMNVIQTSRRIVIPQACRHALPAAGNIWIGLIKNSSLAFTLGVSELLGGGKLAATESLKFMEAYVGVGLIYWALTIMLSAIQRRLERWLARPYVTN